MQCLELPRATTVLQVQDINIEAPFRIVALLSPAILRVLARAGLDYTY